MYTALSATSVTFREFLKKSLESNPELQYYFGAGAPVPMVVTLKNPQEMGKKTEGVSVWLYRVVRDEQTLNAPPKRIEPYRMERTPLPFRLHYLITPIVKNDKDSAPETEQQILGLVLQALYDHPVLRGTSLQSAFKGTDVELNVRLEPLSLEEITRVWDALDRAYQLSVSYEVSVVSINSGMEPEDIKQVEVLMPEYGVIVS